MKRFYLRNLKHKTYNTMKWKFEKEFREAHPETISETDKEFDLYNYKDWLEQQLVNKNDLLQRVRLALLPRKIVEAYKDYDKSCHCSHTAGEEPSYHYRNGMEWVIYRLKKALSNEA